MKCAILSLVPAALLAFSPAVFAKGPKGPSIVDVALAANAPGGAFEGQLDSLITAVLNADPIVLDTLAGNGQFTVFAPTDDAFLDAGLDPDGIVDLASTPEGQAFLTDVLVSQRMRDVTGPLSEIKISERSGPVTSRIRGHAGMQAVRLSRSCRQPKLMRASRSTDESA